FGSCTVHVTAALGTTAPDPSCTCACRGSWALIASVDVEGFTTMVATWGVASGAVLPPQDQLDSATSSTVARVRPILDMLPLPPSAPRHVNHRDARHRP